MPREWLTPGAAPVVVRSSPTRYGRVGFTLRAAATAAGGYTVFANVSLPGSYVGARGPPGGLRLRLRAPGGRAGGLASVTVGGEAWAAFDPAAETVDFKPGVLTMALLGKGLHEVVAVWK